jgi:hypothetical protein
LWADRQDTAWRLYRIYPALWYDSEPHYHWWSTAENGCLRL